MPCPNYPGCQGVVRMFESVFSAWVAAGCPVDRSYYYKADGYLTTGYSGLPSIGSTYVSWSVANFPGLFFLDQKEVQKLTNAARALGLSAKVSKVTHGVHILFKAASPEQFRSCGLNKRVVQERELVRSLIPMAQKFYDLSLIPGITSRCRVFKDSPPNWHNSLFSYSGGYPEMEYDRDGWHKTSDGFLFREFGYRDLENDNELIAFIIASYCHCDWHTTPQELDLSRLRWHLALGTRDGRRTMLTHPYLADKNPHREQPETLRDFF